MNIFIDTNVFLSFYHLTSDDLEELRKLSVLLEKKKVVLYLPDQVVAEFTRNRENKIADAIKRVKEQTLNLQFPQLCKDYEEYPHLRELQKKYEENHMKLLMRIEEDVNSGNLKADKIITELYKNAIPIKTSEKLVNKARFRVDIGNPPGKKGSIGDAINWEAILEKAPQNEDLFFISDDSDYCSSLDKNKFKEFLLKEWQDEKNSQLAFFKKLSEFFKEKFPDIRLASELDKDLLIRNLALSDSFHQTHSLVASMANYQDFTASQANEIVDAALTNTQVNWIISDPDINEFVSKIVGNYSGTIQEEKLEQIKEALDSKDEEEKSPDELSF